MTHAPTSTLGASLASGQANEETQPLSGAHFRAEGARTADASGMSNPGLEKDPTLPGSKSESLDPPDPADKVLVDQAGRPLGPRALQTRRKILEATVVLLSEKPMREMRVIDIARKIGSSPATFYQYFKDVEDVVMHLASQAKEATPLIVDLIGGDWDGPEGHERGKQISNMVIDHWEKYAPVLRARNNASDEGHPGLREERMSALMPLVDAFKAALERSAAKSAALDDGSGDWKGGQIDPLAGATALSSCLERTSMYHAFITDLGSSREDLVETTATFMQSMLQTRR